MALRYKLNGLFAVDKPRGITSRHVLNQLKAILTKAVKQDEGFDGKINLKVGHGGTLDPLATGVLVVGVGCGTKKMGEYLNGDKEYSVIGKLGSATDTFDQEGEVVSTSAFDHIRPDDIELKLAQFRGKILQTPPVYSAVKVDGRKLYEYARKGKVLPVIPSRPVSITKLALASWSPAGSGHLCSLGLGGDVYVRRSAGVESPETAANSSSQADAPQFRLDMACGKGVYVRSVVHDLGLALGSHAHVVALRRTRQGRWTERDAFRMNEWTVDNILERMVRLKPPTSSAWMREQAKGKSIDSVSVVLA